MRFSSLQRFQNLVEFRLEDMQLNEDDEIVGNLSYFHQLRMLSLADNNWEGNFSLDIKKMKSLETFHSNRIFFQLILSQKNNVEFPDSLKKVICRFYFNLDKTEIDFIVKKFEKVFFNCKIIFPRNYLFSNYDALFRFTSHYIEIDHSDFAKLVSFLENSSTNLCHVTSIEFYGNLTTKNVLSIVTLSEFFSKLEVLILHFTPEEDSAIEIFKKNLHKLPKTIKSLLFKQLHNELCFEILRE